ncbi:hypothetical protein AB1Y20_007217 [Prymnesium parvum]|uniref:Uncharacterized protein n=1 Tax=Prymnesium parvum TaxID=97485 RepID=A0AB34IWF0_PRYPA
MVACVRILLWTSLAAGAAAAKSGGGAQAQVDGPSGASRWEEGSSWNADGSIDDSNQAGPINGIVACGNSANTQAQVLPTGVYVPSDFTIAVPSNTCINPGSGSVVNPSGPTAGEPVIWFNFDVRAGAHWWDTQINGGGQDTIAWALYYSTTPTRGTTTMPTTGSELSGDASDLTFFITQTEIWY